MGILLDSIGRILPYAFQISTVHILKPLLSPYKQTSFTSFLAYQNITILI